MGISIWQIVLVLVIILILFKRGKFHVMGDIAKGIKSFKAGMKEGEEAEEIDDSIAFKGKQEKTKKEKYYRKKVK